MRKTYEQGPLLASLGVGQGCLDTWREIRLFRPVRSPMARVVHTFSAGRLPSIVTHVGGLPPQRTVLVHIQRSEKGCDIRQSLLSSWYWDVGKSCEVVVGDVGKRLYFSS
uniref:Uncharacterized protein n=1 Tax=Mycena chlorophos TaxID=658473 RepID=A0ABQ0LH27_MYCCL|nr:predicted protein [Mycena chlorophos]